MGEEATLLQRVIDGLGGGQTLTQMEGVRLDVTGIRFMLDEGFTPSDSPEAANTYEATVSIDVANEGLRRDITRLVSFLGLGLNQTFSEIISGQLGHVEGIEHAFGFPTGDMLSARWAATLRQNRLLNPHLLVLAALTDNGIATEGGVQAYEGRPHELLAIEDDATTITLWVDSETDLISRATLVENQHLRRDVDLEVAYDDWEDSDGGVLFPRQVVMMVDGEVVMSEDRDAVSLNPDFEPGAFEFPEGAEPSFDAQDAVRGSRSHHWHEAWVSVALPQGGLQTFVDAAEVVGANGVFHLTGGTHHSLAVEQDNGVVVFEAPLYAARCEVLLDWIEANIPGKPVTHVVVSHFHQDHSACARTFIAAGATLVIGEGSEAFWSEIMAAPSTVDPDALELGPVVNPSMTVVPNGGLARLDDATNPIAIYDLENTHSVDMILPLVESVDVAFVADLYTPGSPVQVNPNGPQQVLDSLALHGISADVALIAGAHGGVVPLAELQQVAGGQ